LQAALEQKRLLKESQQRLLREAAERQAREHVRAGQAAPHADTGAGEGAAQLSRDGPIGAVVDAVLAAAAAGACPFRRLGMPPHAPREACRKSYLQLALRLHPDKCDHPKAKEAFEAVEEAFRAVEGAVGGAGRTH